MFNYLLLWSQNLFLENKNILRINANCLEVVAFWNKEIHVVIYLSKNDFTKFSSILTKEDWLKNN